MTVVTRFAPSPTGRLHVGNARTALVNWLYARRAAGAFVLRLDDTDAERSGEAHARAIREDLTWLGLDRDGEERQSARTHRYEAARGELAAAGRLYPCYETPAELAAGRRRRRDQGLPPVYDRRALGLDAAARRRLEAAGRRPHWRFRLDDDAVAFDDLIRGRVRFEPGHVSDPVLVREDGTATYMLASVVDDLDMGVTQVIRGEDHVANTAAQIETAAALGGRPPAYAHHPLLVAASGAGLSKREGGGSIAELREAGVEAMALASWLARIGTSEPVVPCHDMNALISGFALETISRSPPRYAPREVVALGRAWLREAPHAAVAAHLGRLGLDAAGEPFWLAVRGNLDRLEDARTWWRVCTEPLRPVIEDAVHTKRAAALLPAEPWDETVWARWTGLLERESGHRGRALIRPLRLALTGLERGPELARLLPFLGRARSEARLRGERA